MFIIAVLSISKYNFLISPPSVQLICISWKEEKEKIGIRL